MSKDFQKILVTGGSGIVGHYVIDELLRRDYDIVNADIAPMNDLSHSGNVGAVSSATSALELRQSWSATPPFKRADVSDYAQVEAAMRDCDAVIALAARPTPFNYPEEDIMRVNAMAVWNVCKAAEHLKIKRVVIGSSYNAVGAQATATARWSAKTIKPPTYFPLDSKSETRAEDAYSVSKWLGEHIADAFVRRAPWMSIASLRFTGVWDDAYFKRLNKSPISDPWQRCQGFWAYVNIKDAARACASALEAPAWSGNARLFVNAKDTMLNITTEQALKTIYPQVELRKRFERFETVLDIEATLKTIGWTPRFSWRDERFSAD